MEIKGRPRTSSRDGNSKEGNSALNGSQNPVRKPSGRLGFLFSLYFFSSYAFLIVCCSLLACERCKLEGETRNDWNERAVNSPSFVLL